MRIILAISIALLTLTSCFTGVESTPKIGYEEVKRQRIAPASPEASFLSNIAPQPPAQWKKGKRFYIADPRAALVFTTQSTADLDSLAGSTITFEELRPVASVTGSRVTEAVFATADGRTLYFRDNLPFEKISEKQTLEVPFAIDLGMVDSVRAAMLGKRYYITTPYWYEPDGREATAGLRHVPADIVDIQPGTEAYPIRVIFTTPADTARHAVLMTLGSGRTSTRNFHTLFAFDDPKVRHPYIKDDVWQLIQHSRVREGMTREECRLALGAPQKRGDRPTRGGIVEYWQYADGTFLLFEEGYLARYR